MNYRFVHYIHIISSNYILHFNNLLQIIFKMRAFGEIDSFSFKDDLLKNLKDKSQKKGKIIYLE